MRSEMDALNGLRCSVLVRAEDPVMRDHTVHGTNIMPGVSFLDLIFRILRSKGVDTETVELRRILFMQPVAASPQFDTELEFFFAVEGDQGDRCRLTVRGRPLPRGDGKGAPHDVLECELHLGEAFPHSTVDLDALRRGAHHTVDMEGLYRLARGSGIAHGEFMKGSGPLYVTETELLAEISLGQSAREYLDYFHLHPACLDASTILPNQFAANFVRQFGEIDSDDRKPYIPLFIESFRARRGTGERSRVHVRPPRYAGQDADLNVCDLDFYDADGRCEMWIRGLTSKRVRDAEAIVGLTSVAQHGPEAPAPSTPHGAEAVSLDALICGLLAEQLATSPDQIDPDRGFYELGLNSTALLQVVRQLESALGLELYPTLLFEHNNVRSLVRYLERQPVAQPSPTAALEQFLEELVAARTRDDLPVDRELGFYDLGLGSADLLDIARGLERAFGRDFSPTLLFEHNTIVALAAHLRDAAGGRLTLPSPSPPSRSVPPDVLYFEGNWEVAPLPDRPRVPSTGGLLVFGPEGRLPALLRDREDAVSVTNGVAFTEEDAGAFRVDPASAEDWQHLVERLDELSALPGEVLWSPIATAPNEGLLEREFDALLHFTAALMRRAGKRDVRIVYCVETPEGSGFSPLLALSGMFKSVQQEHPGIRLKLLWLDVPLERALDVAWSELQDDEHVDVRYRGGRRSVRRYGETLASLGHTPAAELREGGVYLISGGLGGIGVVLARFLAERVGARLVLCGRSELDAEGRARVAQLTALGAEVLYVAADVARGDDVQRVIDAARRRFGGIHGIVHAAGVLRDGLVAGKNVEEARAVLAPKVAGCLHLDRATRGERLDFFLLCSSTAGAWGNPGQTDYACANAFLDAFALERTLLVAGGARHGHTVSVGWSAWQNGGMRLDPAAETELRAMGMEPIDNETGIRIFLQALEGPANHLVAVAGDREQVLEAIDRRTLDFQQISRANPTSAPPERAPSAVPPARLAQAGDPDEDAIAIVGVAGRYPMAENLDQLWENLKTGRDCIVEVPGDRWDNDALFAPEKGTPGRTYGRWGGFVDGVDEFDPLFFHISPKEAAVIDPQERLFLQTVWHTFEDAGHAPASWKGRSVGVYVGVMYSQYQLLGVRGPDERALVPSSFNASIANRASYFFDLRGPSVALDTMCSSSLTAIHQACDSIMKGECEAAVAGGVNVSIHPNKYLLLSQSSFLSSDGRCRAFGEGGDGYVPGEGVGAVLLRPLREALRDGDHVYAVIRGRSLNHGGRSGGFSVPNPECQAQVIVGAHRSEVQPSTIDYIEAHGTGTSLGDPVEVSGLEKAFEQLGAQGIRCPIGSIKSNIGHLESAAGIAAVTKVLLQMRHRKLAPSLHAETLNPNVDWARSPFYVQREYADWRRRRAHDGADDHELPLRACVSSFGAGGSNAHLVLEEYEPVRVLPSSRDEPRLFVFSARSDERLRELLWRFVGFLQRHGQEGPTTVALALSDGSLEELLARVLSGLLDVRLDGPRPTETLAELGLDYPGLTLFGQRIEEELGIELPPSFIDGDATLPSLAARLPSYGAPAPRPPDLSSVETLDPAALAFTLQVGRDAMEERLAVVATGVGELARKLVAYLADGSLPPGAFRGGRRSRSEPTSGPLSTGRSTDPYDLVRLAEAWVHGAEVDFERLLDEPHPRRLSLPLYPFERTRCWIFPPQQPAAERASYPLLDGVDLAGSTGRGLVFRKLLHPEDEILRDHLVNGVCVLAGVVSLELVRAALDQVAAQQDQRGPLHGIRLEKVRWLRPLATQSEPLSIGIALEPGETGWSFEVRSDGAGGLVSHVTGTAATFEGAGDEQRLPLDEIRARCVNVRSRDQLYEGFEAGGLRYGESFRSLERVEFNTEEALGSLELPPSQRAHLSQLPLHPGLMDGALQVAGAFLAQVSGHAMMPYALEQVELLRTPTVKAYAYVRPLRPDHFEVLLLDEEGRVCVRMTDLVLRAAQHVRNDRPVTGGEVTAAHALKETTAPVPAPAASTSSPTAPARKEVEAYIKQVFHRVLEVPPDKLWAEDTFDRYGIDSLTATRITEQFEADLGSLSATLLFEHQTMGELADFFLDHHADGLSGLFVPQDTRAIPAPEPVDPGPRGAPTPAVEPARPAPTRSSDRIAVIGIDGRYPGAPSLGEFWANLREGRDCISEIPAERWDWRELSDIRGDEVSRWGGFLDGVELFDPLFFNMSPREAQFADPQERLFLETVWHTLENAGYPRRRLRGARVGVYVGVMSGHYQLFEGKDEVAGNAMYASIANRVSYCLDLHGPSMAVDSMCSSSLTSLHLACQSLLGGEVDYAVAGGVNVSLHPRKYLQLSVGKFLSSEGRCRSFGADGDGYVPGEGVGAVLLKRLEDAQRDGDPIHAVILGSALGHGGKTSGFYVPNPVAQGSVIGEALDRAGVDPETISYVEAHGTGTALGDPIEINGLTRAFDNRADACSIGSLKSNVGHLESAAGIAALTKVVLQMQHREFVPSIHAETLNPRIDWERTPFRVQHSVAEWQRPVLREGEEIVVAPRRAGVSSFGAGGSNAHVIVEEYQPAPRPTGVADGPFLCPFSARTDASLRGYVEDMLAFLGDGPSPDLADVAYTLQVGREHFEERLALVASSIWDLKERLQRFLDGQLEPEEAGRGRADEAPDFFRTFVEGEAAKAYVDTAVERRDWVALAQLWVNGVDLDWRRFHAGSRVVPLPGYHFLRERYWVPNASYDRRRAPSSVEGGERPEAELSAPATAPHHPTRASLTAETVAFLRGQVARALNVAEERVRAATPLEEYGIESVTIMHITGVLEERLGSVSKTLFFEHRTLNELAVRLVEDHRDRLTALLSPATPTNEGTAVPSASGSVEVREPQPSRFRPTAAASVEDQASQAIAIVGISGRFPQAGDVSELWENLKEGKDCITEVPKSRWDWRDYDRPGVQGSRWGGFVDGVDEFDARFFHISPREAELLDPQERLFLQTSWHALEDSGYTRSALEGSSVGVYVGVMHGHYQLLQNEAGARGNVSYFSIANRVSYFLNLSGPSIALDTACSSSLSAIHLACQSIRAGECDLAIAGGVNVSCHPYKYQLLSALGFSASDGRCRSFGAGGDGYVPGEGVGAVVLKPLDRAIADGDQVHAVVLSSAMNHGGKANGFTVPNPVAQGALIRSALDRSGVDPRSVGYIEAHGTGTSIGDPIEINGLTRAFEDVGLPVQTCAIGSVKSNVGHSESAAGVTAVIKVALQMRHRMLAPSLHSETLNANIPWESSPFYVQRELAEWRSPSVVEGGRERNLPRRAGISSFGAGGANVHLVLEEYRRAPSALPAGPQLIVLSARNSERLRAYADKLRRFLDEQAGQREPALQLADVAYTLQTGRESMESRLAFVATSLADLRVKLARFVADPTGDAGLHIGRVDLDSDEAAPTVAERFYEESDLDRIGSSWVEGAAIVWELLFEGLRPARVSLPGYPFKPQRYWIEEKPPVESPPDTTVDGLGFFEERLRPVAGNDAGDKVWYETEVTGDEFFLRDHTFGGKRLLPGVAHVEIAATGARLFTKAAVRRAGDVVWLRAVQVEEPRTLRVSLAPSDGFVNYEVGFLGEADTFVVCSTGRLRSGDEAIRPEPASTRVDLESIRRRCARTLEHSVVYQAFRHVRFDYGPTFRPIRIMHCGRDEALSELTLAEEVHDQLGNFFLHPSLMDGALQTIAGVNVADDDPGGDPHLPFRVGDIEVMRPLQPRMFAHARVTPGDDSGERQVNVDLADPDGEVLARLTAATIKAVGGGGQVANKPLRPTADGTEGSGDQELLYEPSWVETPLEAVDPVRPWTVLCLSDDSRGEAAYLAETAEVSALVRVRPGDRFRRTGELSYELRPAAEEDYRSLIAELGRRGLMPDRVLHLWNLSPSPGAARAMERGLLSVVALFKAVSSLQPQQRIKCLFGYDGREGPELPSHESLSGFASSMLPVNFRFELATVGFEGTPDASRRLLEEMCAKGSVNGSEIRYEDGRRLVRRLHLREVQAPPAGAPLQSEGVYLITGGMGGLGFVFARYLAEQYRAKLVLTGRSELSSGHKRRLQQLRALGGQASYVRADVTRIEDVEATVTHARDAFGPIQGVIHSAGSMGTPLMTTDRAGFEAPLLPKVQGTLNLDRATRGEPLTLFVLFSSVAARMGDFGAGSYGAANRFLDGYADYRERLRATGHRSGHTLSIGWPLWRDGGMELPGDEGARYTSRTGMQVLTADQGISLFELALRPGPPHIIAVLGQPDKVTQSLRALTEKPARPAVIPPSAPDGIGSGPPEGMAAMVLALVGETLRMEVSEIEPGDRLDTLGFDSITLTALSSEINRKYGLNLDATFFAEASNVDNLIEKVCARAAEAGTPPPMFTPGSLPIPREGEPALVQEDVASEDGEMTVKYEYAFREVRNLRLRIMRSPHDTAVEVLTCGEGEPIVLLPLTGCMSGWMHQLRDLSQTHKVITLQYPGLGASEHTLASSELEAIADTVKKIVDDLGIKRPCHVVGWSMGGFVAQLVAKRFPEMVRSLTLLCSAAEVGMVLDPARWQDIFRKDFTANLPETVRGRPEGSLDFLWGTTDFDLIMRYLMLAYVVDFRELIAKVERPILFVAGGNDIIFPLDLIERSREVASDAQLSIVERGGHYAPVHQAEEINHTMREFISRVERANGEPGNEGPAVCNRMVDSEDG